MKKIFGLCFFTCFLLTALVTTAWATEQQLSRAEIPIATTEAIGLQQLGLFQGTEQGLELERPVTRAEALVMICRLAGQEEKALAYAGDVGFEDVAADHWAKNYIGFAKKQGLVQGDSATTFAPERQVSGQEFAKMLLSALSYSDITLLNAYEKGIACDLLTDNFTKSVVKQNMVLLRSDVARLCFAALTAKTADGGMMYERLIKDGLYQKADFEGILWSADSATTSFGDRMNGQMPVEQNYMFSPLSIQMALGMLANGAEGETQTELLQAAGITNLNQYNQTVKSLLATYQQTDVLKLNVANSLWLNTGKTHQQFRTSYLNQMQQYYEATAGAVQDDNAIQKINQWVDEETNHKIPSIISDNDFWACLINAVYFSGRWQNEFSEENTAPAIFTSRDGQKSQIDFMNRTGWMSYAEKDGVRIVELPYINRVNHIKELDDGELDITVEQYDNLDISMYLLLGDSKVMYPEKLLSTAEFDRQYVKLSLPKFQVDSQIDLIPVLKQFGVEKALDLDGAEFEPMFDQGTMGLDTAIHKTYIKVDEKGTEAAAVTFLGMAGSSLPPEPIIFAADHPFTFIIKDNLNQQVLFMGEYAFAK